MYADLQLRCRPAEIGTYEPPVEDFLAGARQLDSEDDLVFDVLAPMAPQPEAVWQACAVQAQIPQPGFEAQVIPSAWALSGRPAAVIWAVVGLSGVAVAQEVEVVDPPAEVEPVVEAVGEQAPPVAPAAPFDAHAELWTGLIGQRVRLTVAGGFELIGAVVAQREGSVYLAQEPDGAVLEVNKQEIALVRVATLVPLRVPELMEMRVSMGTLQLEEELKTGRRFRVAGITLTSLGIASVATVAVGSGISSSFIAYSWPVLIAGGTMLIAGIPMWVIGEKRIKDVEWYQREQRVMVSGVVAPRPGGWGGQLQMTF
jgi:hypothetical protein